MSEGFSGVVSGFGEALGRVSAAVDSVAGTRERRRGRECGGWWWRRRKGRRFVDSSRARPAVQVNKEKLESLLMARAKEITNYSNLDWLKKE